MIANKIFLVLALLTASFSSYTATPVNCGDVLGIPGGHYVLTGDLACPGNEVLIVAENVHFNLAGFRIDSTIPGTLNGIVALADGAHITGGTVDGLQERWGGPLDYLRSIGISNATLNAVRTAFLETAASRKPIST